MEQLAQDLARVVEWALRLVIAREKVMRVLEEPVGVKPPGGSARELEVAAGQGSPIGVVVAPWRADLGASVLPQSYQDLVEAADVGRPLRAAQIAAAAGLSWYPVRPRRFVPVRGIPGWLRSKINKKVSL
jgi:hypothetical protein